MPAQVRNVLFILCGVAVLVLKSRCAGPYAEAVRSYLGNFSVSFAVYFLCANTVLLANPLLRARLFLRAKPLFVTRLARTAAAASAFAIVALFEETDGFNFMSNTYDPLDNAANATGIAFAVLADMATARSVSDVAPNG